MLAGDDELNDLLASWNNNKTDDDTVEADTSNEETKPTAKSKNSKNNSNVSKHHGRSAWENHQTTLKGLAASRLTENPHVWPDQLELAGGLFHDCPQFKPHKKKTSANCKRCHQSKARHALKSTSNKNKHDDEHILVALFIANRNLRCLCGEFQPDDKMSSQKLQSKAVHYFQHMQQYLQENAKTESITPADLESIQSRLRELQQAILTDPPSSTTDNGNQDDARLEWCLKVLIQSDHLYYRLYYAALTMTPTVLTKSKKKQRQPNQSFVTIPHPPTYFACDGLAWNRHSGESAFKHFQKEVEAMDPSTANLLTKDWRLATAITKNGNTDSTTTNDTCDLNHNNPLHELWKARFLETLRHFWATGYATRQTALALKTAQPRPGHLESEFLQHETLAPPLLADWRDAARDFPASLYSYATPSPQAVQRILHLMKSDNNDSTTHKSTTGMVELGAGTGYWASLIQRLDHGVQPFDVCPPGTMAHNDYHGEVPAFTHVHLGDTRAPNFSIFSSAPCEAAMLFLCYPTPGTDMAANALEAFTQRVQVKSKRIVHVGEWQGLTGDSVFERRLQQDYDCVDYLALPIWGTDAAHLTVWQNRKSLKKNEARNAAFPNQCCNANCQKAATKRCRFARSLVYCSQLCFDNHVNGRTAMLALHMLDLRHQPESIQFNNPLHFQPLDLIAVVKNQVPLKRGQSKSRHKKKRRRR